jgi:hypothetical protein
MSVYKERIKKEQLTSRPALRFPQRNRAARKPGALKGWQKLLILGGCAFTVFSFVRGLRQQGRVIARNDANRRAAEARLAMDRESARIEYDLTHPDQPSNYDIVIGGSLIELQNDGTALLTGDERAFLDYYHAEKAKRVYYSAGQAYRDFNDLKNNEFAAGKGGDIAKWSDEPTAEELRNNDFAAGKGGNIAKWGDPAPRAAAPKATPAPEISDDESLNSILAQLDAEDAELRAQFAGKDENDFSEKQIALLAQMYTGNFGTPQRYMSDYEKAGIMIAYFQGQPLTIMKRLNPDDPMSESMVEFLRSIGAQEYLQYRGQGR